MNRITRITIALLAAAATSLPSVVHANDGDTIYVNGVAYEYRGTVTLGGNDSANLDAEDAVIELVADALAVAGTCAPKKYNTTIGEPSARAYYGAFDSVYVWNDLGEVSIEGCPNNTVDISVQMTDQPLDGTSSPKIGTPKTASGKARAGAVADLTQTYNNLAMSAGFSYHQLTTVVTATQTDGKTKTPWCSKRSWTYRATLTGPVIVGSTPTETVKCAA